jgi:hypothetical protein
LINNGKYFLPPQNDNCNFKQLFKRLTSAGVGRPVDENGFPQGPWTADLLAEAITQVDSNGSGVDLRTVQLWFQDNDKGISTDNSRWLARVIGCDDPDATSQWQMALGVANSRLVAERKKKKADMLPAPPTLQTSQSIMPTTPLEKVSIVLDNSSELHFNLEKKTERLFDNQSSFSLPVIVFSAAAALGLVAFTLNIHSIVHTPANGQAQQVGFLWAPNWTIVFLVILPAYLFFLSELLKSWKIEWRTRLFTGRSPTLFLDSWESRVASDAYSYWAVLIITVMIASGYNWTATNLIPLLNGNTGGWPVDWGKIAIFRPDIISVPSAVVFTGLVFLYNAFCSYAFFAGLIFLNTMTHDYSNIVRRHRTSFKDELPQDIEGMSSSLINGIFRCTSLGMVITIMMKLQSSFLQSNSVDILEWIVVDVRASFSVGSALEVNKIGLRSAPGHFYSFFSMLAIIGTFVNASVRLRMSSFGSFSHISWLAMNGTMFLLVASYLLIGSVTGFTILTFFTLLLTVYMVVKTTCDQYNKTVEV